MPDIFSVLPGTETEKASLKTGPQSFSRSKIHFFKLYSVLVETKFGDMELTILIDCFIVLCYGCNILML